MIPVTTLSELTIDGKLTLGAGASSKDLFDFYGDDLRSWFHAERARHDAIMVGAGTVRSDDPELTVRHAPGRNPLRVIPSSDGLLPLESIVLNDGHPTLVAVSDDTPEQRVADLRAKPGVDVVRCGRGRVDMVQMMGLLEARGVRSLVAEGGSQILRSLFAAGVVSRIVVKHIPVVTGAVGAASYLGEGAPTFGLSRWKVEEMFVLSGVPVIIYGPNETRP